MTTQPKAHHRPKRRTRARMSKVASARDTIAGFDHETDIVGLTYGQFSLIDLVEATLGITGEADVVISTWSAGFYDLDAAIRFRNNHILRSCRFLTDTSRMQNGQAGVHTMADLFGKENVRGTRMHAKFVLISNNDWHVVITSSMNLNLNARCEQFSMTDDLDQWMMFNNFTDELFTQLAPTTRHQHLPAHLNMETVQPRLDIETFPLSEMRLGNINLEAG